MSSRHTIDPRSARRQRLALHLHRCGPRPVLEALIAVAKGQSLDAVLQDFCRLNASTYRRVGADKLPIPHEVVLKGRKP
jgi:hypothetical protein